MKIKCTPDIIYFKPKKLEKHLKLSEDFNVYITRMNLVKNQRYFINMKHAPTNVYRAFQIHIEKWVHDSLLWYSLTNEIHQLIKEGHNYKEHSIKNKKNFGTQHN